MKTIALYLLLLVSLPMFAQQVFFDIGTTVSAFDYKNSQGQKLDNLLSKGNVFLTIGYRGVINKNQTLHFSAGLSYNGYGAIGSDRILDNYFEWDVTYLGLQAGLDFRLFRIRDFSFFIKGSLGAEFLIRGTQTLNNQVYNLVGEDEFNNYIFFPRGHFFVQYPISNNTSIQVGYSYGKTVLIGQGNTTDKEELRLSSHQFGVGLIISLPNCNCPFK